MLCCFFGKQILIKRGWIKTAGLRFLDNESCSALRYIYSAGNNKTRLDPGRKASDFEHCVLCGSRYTAKSSGYRGPAMCRAVDIRVIVKAVFIIQGMKAGHCLLSKKKKNSS